MLTLFITKMYDADLTKVEFGEKFNINNNMIPILKNSHEEYAEYNDSVIINLNESKTINDLIKNHSSHKIFNTYSSYECDYTFCNKETNDEIITIPSGENNYKMDGLSQGITSLIIYDEISGYFEPVSIYVLGEDAYILSYDYNYDNIIVADKIVERGKAYGVLPSIEREGYTLIGWFTDKTNGTKIEYNTVFTGNNDITLYAHWEEVINSYTVTFNSNGGSAIDSQNIIEGNYVIQPNNPTKTGYTFVKWQLNGNDYDFNTAVTGNITLTAVWTINQYTVTFNSNGGSNVASQTINYNGKATKPADPTKTGYTFNEWQLNGNAYDFNTPITRDITLVALWIINKYVVRFTLDTGAIINTQNVEYGNKVTQPTNINYDGYIFTFKKENGEIFDFDTIITSDMNIIVESELKKYTVTFNSNGGSSVSSQTIDYNEKATRPNNPTKEGYTFKEWQLNGNAYNFNTPVTSNMTLIAVWEANETQQNETLKEILQDNSYNVNSNLVSGFKLGMTVNELKNKLGDSNIIVNTNNSIISTGTVIKKGYESYTIVIKGDLNGDGKANSGDLLQMRKYLLEEVNLTGAYKQAGIIESVGNIKSLDLLRLRQYLLGEYIFK